MKIKKYFGTDGIRGVVGRHPITADFVLKLGWAAGRVLAEESGGSIMIGKDTRNSGYLFESALQAGLASAGVDVLLLGPMPTPAVAYLTQTFSACAGIVVSASHNAYQDNGIKFFTGAGQKLTDSQELAIEQMMQAEMVTVSSEHLGKASRIEDAAGRYVEFCKSCFPAELTLKGLKIAVDGAHGAAYRIAPNVFRELGAEVIEIGTSPNGLNINDGVGATSPGALSALVLETGADLGIALDGDGDRLIMVDHLGEIVDGDELLFVITQYKSSRNELQGGVVGTQMSNLGLQRALEQQNIPFARAAVGDRHVLAMLENRGWRIGGEGSGHILCLDSTSTGDGIVSALHVLTAIVSLELDLNRLKQGMKKFPQELVNVRCSQVPDLQSESILQAIRSAESRLGESGRVLLRSSGTEPVVRVMVEGEERRQVEQLAQEIADAVHRAVPMD
ncbi:MAG: phosphoglucosamine mutase [Pseudomonadales bacterium]|jgi:phosphoglucosamine mutase|nr:phosphoglucosamine mutase [Pseudomonadales bacterium]